MKRRTRLFLICALALLGTAPATARADIVFDDIGFEILDAAGEPEVRAGAHPDRLIQSFKISGLSTASERMKEMVVQLPPGLMGSGNSVPLCPRPQANTIFALCDPETQVGVVKLGEELSPVYAVPAAPNEAAAFAVPIFKTAMLSGRLRADQGLSLRLGDLEDPPLINPESVEGEIQLWGVPADHQTGTSIPRRALLTLPTRCDLPPLSVDLAVRSWEQPDRFQIQSATTGQVLTGCAELGFDPSFAFSLDDRRADVPSGARIDVAIPQEPDPDRRATSLLRDLSATLPAGVTVSPGGATGVLACSDAQFGLGSTDDPTCPQSSRVGTVELRPAGLDEPVSGVLYLGQEQPADRFRLFVAAAAAGSQLKFVGSLRADPQTGRLTTTIHNLPQVPFETMSLRFDGGPGALLATPLACGPAPTSARFTPYSGNPAVERAGSVAVGGACSRPFAPTFSGGSTDARAGHPTSFTVTVRRQDGEQLPERLTIALPPGLGAALGKVGSCSAAQAQSGTCPADSRIGAAVAELGPGTTAARLAGDVYLTGPYRRAPFGVALVLPAKLGPFDLGTLVVRGALRVDLLSGQVQVEMDSLPTIFEGLPIRFQAIGLDLDRPGFMRNPTSCAPTRMTASLRSTEGASATPSTPFALHGCVDLPFRPSFSMALEGAGQLRAGGKPGLRMTMRMPAGGANLRSVEARLPRLLELDSRNLDELCARRKASEGSCPRSARIGTARASTPLLAQPMKGFVYVVQPRGGGSPDLWASLSGQGLEVNLRGETVVRGGQTETRFVDMPDFPLKLLSLQMTAGEDGVLRLKRKPCGRLSAPTDLSAQNGARRKVRTRVEVRARCKRDG